MNISQFLRLIRVPTLAATAVPLIVGGAVGFSEGRFAPLFWLDIFVVALLIQIATNVLNEYGDFKRKIDTVPSPGFAGLIVSGEASARQILTLSIFCYTAALFLGITLVIFRGIILLVLGAIALLPGILYSEGPLPISSTPFGEVLVAAIMGPVEVVSANLAASGQVSTQSIVFSVPVSLLVAAILLANNLRDFEKDRDHGRRTLAVTIGRRYGSTVLLALIVVAFLWTVPAFLLFHSSFTVFLVWLAFPIAIQSYLRITRGGAWPDSVAIISRLYMLIGALLAISILFRF